jgi:peptidyl-prolyl cis-trans isomerase C
MILRKARLWIALASCAATPAFAQNIAVVNGAPVPKAYADALVNELARQGQPDSPQLQVMVREELVNRELLMQEALRRGIPNRPNVKAQIALADQSVVIRSLIDDFLKANKPTHDEIKARYDEFIEQTAGQELHLHHILVPDEQQAKDLIAKIKGGARFEGLAKQHSKDPGSAKNGGDLDWANPQSYDPAFAEAASKLKKGEMTLAPVHTQFGWHIIRLDDSRAIQPPPLDQVEAQIAQQLAQQKLQQFSAGLREKAKIQ